MLLLLFVCCADHAWLFCVLCRSLRSLPSSQVGLMQPWHVHVSFGAVVWQACRPVNVCSCFMHSRCTLHGSRFHAQHGTGVCCSRMNTVQAYQASSACNVNALSWGLSHACLISGCPASSSCQVSAQRYAANPPCSAGACCLQYSFCKAVH